MTNRDYYSQRVDSCCYPERGDPRCGVVATYQFGCSDTACKNAWRTYCKDRRLRKSRGTGAKIWKHPHGTIENSRQGCPCKYCKQAENMDMSIRLAEDWCFGVGEGQPVAKDWREFQPAQPFRVSSLELRLPHGESRAGYRRKCRCPQCVIQNRLEQAQRRGSPKVQQILVERAALRVERQAIVSDYLDWLGLPDYDDYAQLELDASERSEAEWEARARGDERLQAD